MTSRDNRKHLQLRIGYVLVALVLAFGSAAVSSQIQHYQEQRDARGQAAKLVQLSAEHSESAKRIAALETQNAQQADMLDAHRADLARQDAAIARLDRLSEADVRVLRALNAELRLHFATDQAVRKQLQQLESNNAAARAAIESTDAKAKP